MSFAASFREELTKAAAGPPVYWSQDKPYGSASFFHDHGHAVATHKNLRPFGRGVLRDTSGGAIVMGRRGMSSASAQDRKTINRMLLRHELTHWRQLQKGQTHPTNFGLGAVAHSFNQEIGAYRMQGRRTPGMSDIPWWQRTKAVVRGAASSTASNMTPPGVSPRAALIAHTLLTPLSPVKRIMNAWQNWRGGGDA